ncbi:DNA-directed RNA polymerase II subunit RPB1-like [Achroia grisella]|uniref:DNA-directed RNA polymerase II subunit RPB1-like n=1 Tax=Achroia grisella TaxID=688607 RepID=UPI0027D1F28E|nr:DNA-directed RNA polymerase II subunit RPB1-like [Achroia grisella]
MSTSNNNTWSRNQPPQGISWSPRPEPWEFIPKWPIPTTPHGTPATSPTRSEIHIDLPENSGLQTQANHGSTKDRESLTETIKSEEDEYPVLYIDLPERGHSDVSQRIQEGPSSPPSRPIRPTYLPIRPAGSSSKVDLDENPVVYIDLPETSNSDVCEPRRTEAEENPPFIQDTILYDQFKDRRIQIPNTPVDQNTASAYSSLSSGETHSSNRLLTLHNYHSLPSPEYTGNTATTQTVPSPTEFRSITSHQVTPDEHRFPPHMQINYPDPPPPYSPTNNPVILQQPVSSPTSMVLPEHSRTIVITDGSQQHIVPQVPGSRKYIFCHHCRFNINSLVIHETGFITHIWAIVLMMCGMFPFILLIYWGNCCKYKNHYCPHCHKKIAYVRPCGCDRITVIK